MRICAFERRSLGLCSAAYSSRKILEYSLTVGTSFRGARATRRPVLASTIARCSAACAPTLD